MGQADVLICCNCGGSHSAHRTYLPPTGGYGPGYGGFGIRAPLCEDCHKRWMRGEIRPFGWPDVPGVRLSSVRATA
jgi:hypothetical protein